MLKTKQKKMMKLITKMKVLVFKLHNLFCIFGLDFVLNYFTYVCYVLCMICIEWLYARNIFEGVDQDN